MLSSVAYSHLSIPLRISSLLLIVHLVVVRLVIDSLLVVDSLDISRPMALSGAFWICAMDNPVFAAAEHLLLLVVAAHI